MKVRAIETIHAIGPHDKILDRDLKQVALGLENPIDDRLHRRHSVSDAILRSNDAVR